MKLCSILLANVTADTWVQPTYKKFLEQTTLRNNGGWGHPLNKIAALHSLCPDLDVPGNSELMCDQSTCAVKCADTFIATGKRRTRCRWNKKKGFHWKAALGPCETCSAPLIAPAGVASVCTVKRGKSMCTQTCEAADHVFSSPASTPATFNLKCKCPRSGAGTPRVCGWYSGKMGGEVTQTTFDGIACEAAPTEVTTTAVVTETTTAVVGDTTTAVAGDTTTVVVGDTTTAVVGDTTTAVVGDTTTAVVGDTTAMGDTTTGMGDTTTAVVEATTTTVAAETTTRRA